MSRLEGLLTKAMEMRAGELWMAPGQTVRVRIGREWRELSNESWAAHETKALLSSPLSEFDKREFFERGQWTGSLRLVGRTLQLQLRITDQGIAGSMKWRGPEALDFESWNFPAHMLEILGKTRGLSVISGPSYSGKTSLLLLLMQKLSQNSGQLIHLYGDQVNPEIPARVSSFALKTLPNALSSCADLIFVDSPSIEHWSTILDLSESGRHVVMTMTGLELFAGLERWRMHHDRSGRRGLETLQLGLGTRLVAGLENVLVPATEILLVTQKLRPTLSAGQWAAIEDEMRTTGEKTGMRTLNQSLLQLLLRRKIEIRAAFQETTNPDEFDHLLKKVGI